MKKYGPEPKNVVRGLVEETVASMYAENEENKFLEVTYAKGEREIFYFKDFSSGAMLKNIVDRAKKAAKGAAQGVMKKAIEVAPDRMIPGGTPDPAIEKHGHVGRPVSRVDGPLKVQGKARFAAEFSPQQLAYAALLFSTIAKGRIARLETTEASVAPGVILVMTYKNAPRMKSMPLFMTAAKAAGGDNLPIMQDDRIHWNGQPVALVLAETQEHADHAKSLIRVTYDAEPAITSFEAAMG